MKSIGKLIILLIVINTLFSCCGTSQEELTVSKILHDFNWLVDDGYYEKGAKKKPVFENKPFLKKNADGNNGAAGVLDIDRDGELEFIMAAYHVPRGIPSVEVFTIKDNQPQSLGGFFESRENPQKLLYYSDKQDRLLFLQETQAHYGGITTTLVATYTDTLKNKPIASKREHYYEDGAFPDMYYVFPNNMTEECTNHGLCVAFSESDIDYSATEKEYSDRIYEFISTLTFIEAVEYHYSAYYHLYNYHELSIEIRGKEISEGLSLSPPKNFYTPEEIKKTSDMIADSIYADYYGMSQKK